MELIKIWFIFFAHRVDEVHLFAFDNSPKAALAGVNPETRQKIVCHDGWTDSQGWNQNG